MRTRLNNHNVYISKMHSILFIRQSTNLIGRYCLKKCGIYLTELMSIKGSLFPCFSMSLQYRLKEEQIARLKSIVILHQYTTLCQQNQREKKSLFLLYLSNIRECFSYPMSLTVMILRFKHCRSLMLLFGGDAGIVTDTIIFLQMKCISLISMNNIFFIF